MKIYFTKIKFKTHTSNNKFIYLFLNSKIDRQFYEINFKKSWTITVQYFLPLHHNTRNASTSCALFIQKIVESLVIVIINNKLIILEKNV